MWMTTPGSARNELKPEIEALIGILNVHWVEHSKFYDVTGFNFGPETTSGVYEALQDVISVRPRAYTGKDPNYVFLHELTHWTGMTHRLNRPIFDSIFNSNDVGADRTLLRAQEEAVAEWGAYKLSMIFGLDRFKAKVNRDLYHQNPSCKGADLVQAEKDAQIAVDWILDQLNKAQVKAA